jgi:hypothetical protein
MRLHRSNTIRGITLDPSPSHMKRPFRARASVASKSRDIVPGWYEPPRWGKEQ